VVSSPRGPGSSRAPPDRRARGGFAMRGVRLSASSDGAYDGYTFNDPNAGTAVVTIRKAAPTTAPASRATT